MSATLAPAVSPKRLLSLVALACVSACVLVAAAPAGSIDDGDPCPKNGANDLVCPPGTEGTAYSIKFHADEDPPCAPGDDKWTATNGSVPPGLSMAENGQLSGTPTQAGSYSFWVEMKLPDYWLPEENRGCSSRDNSEEHVTLTINPGLPRLIIGPESAPAGTVSSQYSLQMTATVGDPKTWSVVDGALPPGLALGASDGLISGMPSAAGTYTFTVRAAVNGDSRSDTKVLGIAVRDRVAITAEEAPASEVSVPFQQLLTASGGTQAFTWAVASGTLPSGLALGPTGTIAGTPTASGTFRFSVSATDTEGRVATLPQTLRVAARVTVATRTFRPAKVGRYFEGRLRASGGVQPVTWKLKRGPLPRGIRFDRALGLFYGTPTRPGRYRVLVEVRDALRVAATRTVLITVRATKVRKTR
jgi:hypothetical protein